MDEFGSPILGGVNAVRRTVSSSMFAPRQPQRQPDSITTNLLSQQSLQLTSVSQQLERISTQVTSLNSSLSGVRENLVVSGQIDRQREAAKQKRERILAEQGLREGKESALEAKIQNALVQPLQKVAIKTQGTLGNLKKFLLILAGGWLTNTGIDLIKAQSEGNTEKLNELKAKFVSGLLVIGGTITALSIGIKNSFRLLGVFVNSISRVAFGGLLKTSLGGLRRLFSGIAAQAAGGAVGNFLSKGLGRTVSRVATTAATAAGTMGVMSLIKKGMDPAAAAEVTQKAGNRLKPKLMQQTKGQKLLRDATTPAAKGQGFLSGIGKRARNITKKIVGKGKNITAGLAGPKSLGAAANPTKKGFGRLLSMLGIKGGLKQAFKRFGGPVATLIINLATGDSLGKALAATAGYAAASAAAAKLLSPLLLAPIPGARILYGILVLAGGIVGESAIRGLYDGIAGLFGFGKKDKTDKEIKAKGNSQLLNKPNNEDMTYDGLEIVPISDISLEDQEKMGLIEPVKSNASEKANEISDMDEGQPAIINLPTSGSQPQVGGSNKIKKSEAATVPKIFFDNENPHTLYGAATYGVGN